MTWSAPARADKNELISLFTQAMDYRFTGSVVTVLGHLIRVKGCSR